jgi:dihydrofolate reductase
MTPGLPTSPPAPRLSVFLACSLDGYIATTDDSLDWLDASVGPGEDYGYEEHIASIDALAMGRGTYDFIEAIDPLPFGDRKLFVFTHRAIGRSDFTPLQQTPQEAVAAWAEQGLRHVYVDGGVVISAFLEAGLIDDLTLTIVPLLLGDGRPLFHPGRPQTRLRLEESRTFPSGVVWLRYRRASGEPEPVLPPAE